MTRWQHYTIPPAPGAYLTRTWRVVGHEPKDVKVVARGRERVRREFDGWNWTPEPEGEFEYTELEANE